MGRLLYDESNLPEISSLKALDYDTVDKETIEPIKRVGVLTSGGDAPAKSQIQLSDFHISHLGQSCTV